MTARVLVVDDIKANVKLLQARLTAEYFEVQTASNGPEALAICSSERADVVLLDVMMPGMDGFEVCRRLKANPQTCHIPVIMVTALDQPTDMIMGLEAGADDFVTKPVDDIALITRVKNLARLKMLNDEMIMRVATSEQLGLSEEMGIDWNAAAEGGRILLVEDHVRSGERIVAGLQDIHKVDVETDPQVALMKVAEGKYDLLVVSLNLVDSDGLRLCSQVRSLERTRHLPILMIVEPTDNARLLRGLDMGVNDYLLRPVCLNEMKVRVGTQIKRKRFSDYLQNRFEENVEMAVTDALTGLYNRRYLEGHLRTLVSEAVQRGKNVSALVVDIDYFKSVNDTYGHDVGDDALREVAHRIRQSVRGIDMPCRLGGEEFVVIMPDTDLTKAYYVAERIRKGIAEQPFEIGDGLKLNITASVGVAVLEKGTDSPEALLKRADQALYCAKRDGRNRVVADAA